MIWALWFIGTWLYYSLLPYKAPRYFVLLAPPLVAGAAIHLDAFLSRESWRLRAPARLDEHLPLAVWLYVFCFTAIDATKHYATMMLEYLGLPPPKIDTATYEAIVSVFRNVDSFNQTLAWGAVFAIAIYLVVLWNPEICSRLGKREPAISASAFRTGAIVALAVSLGWSAFQYTWWMGHRTTFLEDVKTSLPWMIGPDAVVLGPLAPLLTQDMTVRALPYFGPPGEPGLPEKYGVTHLLVCGDGDAKVLEERYPGLLDQATSVQTWPVRTLFSSSLELLRVPPAWDGVPIHDYQPTAYEQGTGEAHLGNWRAALDRFQEYRDAGGAVTPELLSFESVCWFRLEDWDRSEELLLEAIRRRPKDPLLYQNLGVLYLSRGDRALALAALMRSLRLDPKNQEVEAQVLELAR